MEKQLSNVVDSLETKVNYLLKAYNEVQEKNLQLIEAFQKQKSVSESLMNELEDLRKKYTTLKNAKGLLGSDEYKKETKHKISTLIREIDMCIAQLS